RGAGEGGRGPEARARAGPAQGLLMLRIVHVVSSLRGGGMEHFVLRLARAQRKSGHDASVVAITGGPLRELAQRQGVPVTVLRGRNKVGRVAHAAARFAMGRPHVVHCHNPTSLHYAVIGKLVSLAALVFTDHAQTRGIVRRPSACEWRLVDAYASVS